MISIRIVSALIALSFVLSTPMMPLIAFAEDAGGDSGAAATGGGGGDGGTGGSGDSAGDGGTGGTGGTADSTSTGGDGTATGGDGGTGGTGGDSTGGGTEGTGGTGGDGGTGGTADTTAGGGPADATAGDGGSGGDGGAAQGTGTAGDGGTGATGGDAAADSTTDGSDASADATAGDGGIGGNGGEGNGAAADGGAGGDGGSGGTTDASADAENSGDADTVAEGGGGGAGGSGGGGGSATDPVPDGISATIETGDANAGSAANTTANTTDSDVPLGSEDGDETEIEIGNVLGATSTASSTALTGENEIVDPDGSFIKSGIANSFAYLISLFNIAITNSTGSILFLKNPIGEALNFTARFAEIFGDMARNGACSLVGCSLDDAVLSIYTESVAEVTNSAVTRSYSGGNYATSSDGTASIDTGDTSAFSGVVNIGNLNIYDSRYLLILMANQGDLSGDILLPDGAFFERLSTGAHIGRASDISASSSADIGNTADASAETGANEASGVSEADIATGNATADASAVNFVNHLGAPICFIVNVGGEWRGDVIQLPRGFSRDRAEFGDVICGAGGAGRDGAAPVELEVVNYAKILNTAIAEAASGNNHAAGLVAKIKTGDADAFAQILNLVNMTIIGQDWIFANFAVSGDWQGDLVFGVKPGQPDILGDLISTHVTGGGGGGGGGGGSSPSPNITFTKEADVVQATSPAKVTYTLTVQNSGGKARQVVVEDTMKGPNGNTIGKQMWNLGTIKENEEVQVKYTIEFKGDVTPGYYTNSATLYGLKNSGEKFTTLTASDVVEVLPPGEVLGVACEPVLTEYVRPWRINSQSQVVALQSFLNTYEGEHLATNGVYDSPSQAAVKRFQSKYSSDILAPWGITTPTGNVYYTTQRKVNQIFCKNEQGFDLSDAQRKEIESFRAKVNAPESDLEDLLENSEVGKLRSPEHQVNAPLMPPTPEMSMRIAPVSSSKKKGGVGAFNFLSSWLMTAVPFVEALEIQ